MKKFLMIYGLLLVALAVAASAFADPALANPFTWKALLGGGAVPALLVNASTVSDI